MLIGLAQPCVEAFADIDWGSSEVFDQTMRKLAAAGRRVSVQPMLWDVDVPADFERLAAELDRFVELGEMQFGGAVQGDLRWRREGEAGDAIGATGSACFGSIFSDRSSCWMARSGWFV